MASSAIAKSPVRTASKAFYFNSSAHLLRIGRERASTLVELLAGLRSCPEDSIFQHTFRTLEEHHFIREGFSNDFAHWTFTVCKELALAEQLASIDVREFTSIADLRERGTLRLLLRMRAVAGLSEIPILAVVDASDGLSVKDGFNDVLEHPVDRADLLERVIGLSRRRRFG